MAAQKSNWGKELRMGEGAAKASRSTTGRLSGGHHSKPEDFNRTGRRSDGLSNGEDSKRTGVRSNEDVRETDRISDDQKIPAVPKSTLGNEQIKPGDVEPKRETEIKSKDKVKCSEETILSADLRRGVDQSRQYHQPPGAGQTGPEDQRGVAEVNLQTVSVSEGGEKEKTINHFRENNLATQCQEVTNQKLSDDICNNAIASEPTTIVSVSSHKSLRI